MKDFALNLIRTHGKEKAQQLAESCLKASQASKQSGGNHYADELDLIKKRRNDPKPVRLHKTVEFWRQVSDLVKKS